MPFRIDVVDLIVLAAAGVLVAGIVKSSTELILGSIAVIILSISFGAYRMFSRIRQKRERALQKRQEREDI